MKSTEIRRKWLEFFAEKGHKIEPSASLVPHNDPSLLWINAGMAPLKPYFDGRMKPENPRMANVQKCIRTNDIENVGKTRRHHTFFEMLGNFSIGDYFKKEAIHWAWELLTDKKWIGLDPGRLHVTIHSEDDEAFRIWHGEIGLDEKRIIRLEDNFWDIGEGPCGPCTEIFYDRGPQYGDDSDPECYPGGENERYLEIWNLVFSEFNHNKDGTYTPLPNKNIDTGAGLERWASILQDTDSNFETDLLFPIIEKTCEIAGVRYKANETDDVALKVIADHIRTVVFSVGDGVLPSNEGRGYVIRRLLRRAVRYGKQLGMDEPFLYRLTAVVGDIMGEFYREIAEKRSFIEQVIKNEESRFHETLSDGLAMLAELAEAAKASGKMRIEGQDAFKLYDTYGFPMDLTEDFAREHGLEVDHEGFRAAMEEQRARARAARQDIDSMQTQSTVLSDFTEASEFVGYEQLACDAKVLAIIVDETMVDLCGEGQACRVILDRTPFYAEGGGQVSDKGELSNEKMRAVVQDVSKAPHGQHLHHVVVESGVLRKGDLLHASVARQERLDTIKNHTATHLLHRALKDVLGEHVNQAGSLVAPDRLRFDFSHFGALTEKELQEIEAQVNRQIWLDTKLSISHMPLEKAKAMGATALFGEKYGSTVRVVQIGDYSMELCGGCHVAQTAQIGLFKIISESGIGSGVRRIEAVTGRHAYQYMNEQIAALHAAADLLKSAPIELPKKIEGVLSQMKDLQREMESLRAKLGRMEAGQLLDKIKDIRGIPFLAAAVPDMHMDGLRQMADELKNRLPSAVIVLASPDKDKVHIVVSVSNDLIERGLHAGQIAREVAAYCGGGGGGRPDLAQAGGKDPAKLAQALQHAEEWLGKKEL